MIVALDLETTGIDKEKDKIIEIAFLKFDKQTFEIIDTFSTLINPLIPIPEVISNITNIFDADVLASPILNQDLKNQIETFIGESPLLGHNTNFDRDFLIKNGIQIENNIILDTFVLSNIILPYEKSLNLGSLCESLDISLTSAHRAMADTVGTWQLFKKLVFLFQSLPNEKKECLEFIFSKSNHTAFTYYQTVFGFKKTPLSGEDFIQKTLHIVGKYNEATHTIQKQQNLCIPPLQEVFSSLPLSELRNNQLDMSNKIQEVFINHKKFIIEAPTGIGKTFAYLIPGIFHSLKNGEQIIVSTNTKALQDQIFYKDLQFLHQHIGYDFSFSKLKGKKNYFSISRYLEYIFAHPYLDSDETGFFAKISLWLFDTEFGELDELNYYGKEYNFQRNIHSDAFGVLLDNNEYKLYEYMYKARMKAQSSNIVIINHSLLIQDRVASVPLFGNIQNLIIDEAHNLEDTTTDALKKTFSLQNIQESKEKILHILYKSNFTIESIENKLKNLASLFELLFDICIDYCIKKNTFGNDNFEVLIEKDFYKENKNIINISHTIAIQYIEIFNLLQTSPDKIFHLLKTEIGNLEEIMEILNIITDENGSSTYIQTISCNKNGNNNLSYTVLQPGEFLKTVIWNKIDSLILTSATLKINDTFDYITRSLYLHDFDFLSFESDFDYTKQVLLFIPNDLGSIKYNNQKINEFILKFLMLTRGNTLVLLTSFNAIKDIYLTINIPLKKLGVSVLAQGVGGSKHKIANSFKKHANNSVILGTDSFWEGVDIPGQDLKYLFIHKFPFSVPTDPIFKARSKLYQDAFLEYSIPKAILKTKQGFGRLIRTKTDTGIVILLDDRYYATSWGMAMKSSFPEDINIKIGNSFTFLELLKSKM